MSKVIRNEFIYSDEFDFDRFESTRSFLTSLITVLKKEVA